MDAHSVIIMSIADALVRAKGRKTPGSVVGALFGRVDKETGRTEALHAVALKELTVQNIVEQEELRQIVEPDDSFIGAFAVVPPNETTAERASQVLGEDLRALAGPSPPIVLFLRDPSPKDGTQPLSAWSFDGLKWSSASLRIIVSEAESISTNEVLPRRQSLAQIVNEKTKGKGRILLLQRYLHAVQRGDLPRDERLVAKVVHVIKRAKQAPSDRLPEDTIEMESQELWAIGEALAFLTLKGDEAFVQQNAKMFSGHNHKRPEGSFT